MTGVVEPRLDLKALTGIRGVAAWFVVLYHIRLSLGPNIPAEAGAILSRGYLAVDLFFMLSGFVLWLNYSERLRADGLKAFPRFIGRRIARIWPLHAFMLLVAVAFACLLVALGKEPNAAWSELPLHILLVHNWGFTNGLAWNDPSWSISGEFAAYLLFPLLALAVDWRRLAPETLILLVILLAMTLHQIMAVTSATSLNDNIAKLGIVRALLEFAMGTILCALWMHWRDGRRGAVLLALVPLALFLVLKAPSAPETAVAPILLAALLFVVAVTAERAGNPLASRPIHYLGLISYSTYLVHFLLFAFFKILFVREAFNLSVPLAALFLVLTFAASILLFHGLERPAQRALTAFFDARASRGHGRRAAAQPGA
jgi:peptidoglycan/LPS O-acetylase OafA/YrhL